MAVDQSPMNKLITEHIDIWTSAVKTRSTSGRGSSKKLELYGVKKLRELILELAVRGKLVPQDPSDEPASVLLERIAEEKKRLVKDKLIPRTKGLPPINEDEIPIDLPNGWTVVRLGELTSKLGSGSTPRGGKNAYTSEGIPFLRSQNVRNEGIKLDDIAYISEEIHQKMENTKVLPGDVLLNITGASLGRSTIFPSNLVEANVSQHVTIIRLIESQMNQFIHLGILSPLVQQLVWGRQVGMAIEGLSKKVLEMFEFPIPPIAEQHRIVAKVDELMALCDQLEQQTEASIEAHQVLVTTLLDTLTNSADADELMQNWARISEHFDTLFTTEESIDQLKQTILQLAVMGALSQPLNSDTSIDVHLDNILEQQKQLATAKEYSLIEAEVLKAKNEISNNRVVLKARCFCNFITKGTTPSKNELLETGDVPFLKVYNIVNNELDFDYRPIFISNEVHTSKLKRSIAHPGDVIMNIVGPPLGKVAVLSEQYPQWNMNQALAVFKPVSSVFNRYLYYVLSCELTLRSVLSEVKGTAGQDNLSLEQCRDLLVPIISIQEQQRLVCLVDSLWDYCDRLKKRMKSSQKTQLHLTDAVTGQAV
ncbi:restriction endonuclease subunit S [Vibrio parahaemolyticus]|nr:restriction endonuclease subunit S [Vibrio parahaemolyticus]